MEKLSYILHEEENEKGLYLLGFNKFNTPGYIDDGSGWSDDDRDAFFDDVLEPLSDFIHTFECMEFTFEVHNLNGLEEKLAEMGISKQEPEWLK